MKEINLLMNVSIKNMKVKPQWFCFIVIFAIVLSTPPSLAEQQRFRVTPQNLQVLEGAEALLRCELSHLAGAVQWTKDGFALGFSGVIAGYPRYSVLGDRTVGVYNLKISNASLEDDAEYQCQVAPAKLNKAIRANANLTVISPPSSISIDGYAHNSKVEVRENQDLTITCTVANSKPPAQIQWYRGNLELKTDNREDKTIEVAGKRFTVTSKLHIKPTTNDDYMEYSCQAKHKALQPDSPMKATIQVSVLFPPGPPYIEGYTPGETLRRGQNVELACRSHGGNPPAQLIWYKNDAQVKMAYRTANRLSESIYAFTVEAQDNKARFRCEASNIISEKALKVEFDLSVLFPPTHVTISGPTEARSGDTVGYQCVTAPSNPAAEIRWTIDGKQVRNATFTSTPSKDGGWLSASNISLSVDSHKRSFIVMCHGINMQLAENVLSSHTLNILYPPSTPIITGYQEGSVIPAGSNQKLLCMSSGGNPPATLTWYKNDKKITANTKAQDNSVQSELLINANITDNQARYRCEAQNSATDVPLFETKILSVHFLPDTLKIRVEPKSLTVGTEATLFCDSSSSNPPAKLTWWKDGIPVEGASEVANQAGLWGGMISSTTLKINMTQDMNDVKYTCQGTNEALQRSVNEVISLQVLYPPKFTPPPSSTAVGIEGESLTISMAATGNPTSIQYTWTRDGNPLDDQSNGNQRILFEGSTLNITKLIRSDGGIYSCEAVNSQGSTTINITVVVEYGATIKSISEHIIVNPGEEAQLSCSVEGNPLTENHIRWERLDYNSSKMFTTYDNGTSFLHIPKAQREDIGNFRCIADNRVANPISRDVLLIVKFIPEIDKSPTMLRAASNKNEKGRLSCRVQAAPQPSFIWSRSSNILNVTHSPKYTVENRKIDSLTYESTLVVDNVETSDYGQYECRAENELGFNKENIRLDITSKPDPPLDLIVLNTTHDSVTLAWTPGFDGGVKAKYRLRYREGTSDLYKYEDSLPNSLKLTIAGLKKNTMYLFSIMAYNNMGSSQYLPDLTKASTKAPLPSMSVLTTESNEPTDSPFINSSTGLLLLIGISSGTGLVLINILLIACCLHKRHKKNLKGGLEFGPEALEKDEMPKLLVFGIALVGLGLLLANTALVAWFIIRKRIKEPSVPNSKSAAIEMYAPSSYNDTVTGETLSSVSDKSDSYSNDGSQPDLTEEVNRKAVSTYVVEDSDIPPPRYQKDGRLSPYYTSNPNINNQMILGLPKVIQPPLSFAQASYEDQMMNHKNYVKIPSPGPGSVPLDGSYYNMQSERYLSYPPMHPQFQDNPIEFPIASSALQHISGHDMSSRSNTLNRRSNLINHNLIPPPDVTHHTNKMQPMHLKGSHMGNLMDVPPQAVYKQQPHHPPSILKDPKRNQQNHHVNKDLQMQNLHSSLMAAPSDNSDIVTATNHNGNSVLLNAYDNANLNSFNAQLGISDQDGHLV